MRETEAALRDLQQFALELKSDAAKMRTLLDEQRGLLRAKRAAAVSRMPAKPPRRVAPNDGSRP